MSFLEEVGKKIANQRSKLGWTQEELMNKLPADVVLSDKQISRLEKGKSGTKLETFKDLALTLQKTPDYFLLGYDRNSTTVKEIISEIEENLLLCEFSDLKIILMIVKSFAENRN